MLISEESKCFADNKQLGVGGNVVLIRDVEINSNNNNDARFDQPFQSILKTHQVPFDLPR